MGDLSKVASVISDTHDTCIATTPIVDKKEQIFRTASNGSTFRMGDMIIFNMDFEQSNRILDNVAIRYQFQNTHATANVYSFNGIWPLIDKMELKTNGSIDFEGGLGCVNLMSLMQYNDYESWSRFVSERLGTFIQNDGFGGENVYPGNFKFPIVNGASPRFESYLSEVIKILYKVHVKYVRNFQLILYLKSGLTNPHKILAHDAGFNFATNFSLINVDMVLYFTHFKEGHMPLNIVPKIMIHDRYYEDKIFDVSAFAGTTSTVDIRIDNNYRPFFSISRAFIYTDSTATNATYNTTNSDNVYVATDITGFEILKNGNRYLLYDSNRAILCHQNRWFKRKSLRRTQNWWTHTQLNNVPCNFIDFSRDDIVLSNDGHYKTELISNGINNLPNISPEWRVRITGNWVAIRPNLHLVLEVSHITSLFSDPNVSSFYQQ